jgi:hypothetical protein
MLHEDYDRKGSDEKKRKKQIDDRESQGAWRQQELVGGKVTLTLALTLKSVEFQDASLP